MKLGYIGLGNMGAPMVANLLKAGCDVTVYDLQADKVEQAVAVGAHAGTSATEVAAQVDILFTSLPQPQHVEQVLPSALEVMQPNSIWVDLTTNDRNLVLRLATLAQARGVKVVDAPVTGAVDGARLGRLTFFVGGETDVISRVHPYFDIMGKYIECGELGNGNVVKLITNQIWFINAVAVGEALTLGKKSGVDLRILWDALKNSVGDTFVVRHDVPSIFAGHYDPSFALDLCCKDLRLLKQLSEEVQVETDVTALVQEKFEQAKATFGGEAAELLVCKLTEDAAKTNLRVEGDWQKHWEV